MVLINDCKYNAWGEVKWESTSINFLTTIKVDSLPHNRLNQTEKEGTAFSMSKVHLVCFMKMEPNLRKNSSKYN